MFSVGVIIFTLVNGKFPFAKSLKGDAYYKYIIADDLRTYFRKVNCQHLSEEFKDMFIKMVSYDPAKRITCQELKEHPWLQENLDF